MNWLSVAAGAAIFDSTPHSAPLSRCMLFVRRWVERLYVHFWLTGDHLLGAKSGHLSLRAAN